MLSIHAGISFDSLKHVVDGSCILCGNPTELKSRWRNGNTGETWDDHFDLCEACKLVPSCFTCRHGKPWYFRYRGKCDIAFGGADPDRPDCHVFPGKRIGDTIGAFAASPPCGRYRRGDATKNEFDEYNSDW